MKQNNTASYDILFLHPPASFNKIAHPLSGVFPAEVGTNDLFLHPPVGVMALYHRLERQGFTPGFVNLGREFDHARRAGVPFHLEERLRTLPAAGFGIDLHWAVHTPGALDLAAAVKKVFPRSFVFLGGLTATYFYKELLQNYPFIDAVIRGEADEAIGPLARALEKNPQNPNLTQVPNIAHCRRVGGDVNHSAFEGAKRGDHGIRGDIKGGHRAEIEIIENPVKLPETWENVDFSSVETGVSAGFIAIKGCNMNCPFCGGSRDSYKNFFFRCRPIAPPPEQLARQMEALEQQGVTTIYLAGDPRMMGQPYTDAFLKALKQKKLSVHVQGELFNTAPRRYLEKWKRAVPNSSLILSPESADIRVRRRMGKEYSQKMLNTVIANASDLELPLVLSFLFALPEQDAQSIRDTADFIEEAIGKPHISFAFEPMLYIDPASPVFEDPETWGYHIDWRTIHDFKEHFEKPHWSQAIGYHTRWLSKERLVDMIYETAERVAHLRARRLPIFAPRHLLTVENIDLNRSLPVELFTEDAGAETVDAETLRDRILNHFPPYLLTDNMVRKVEDPPGGNDPYTPFPYLVYLLTQVYNVSPHRLIPAFKQWAAGAGKLPETITVEAFKAAAGAPAPFKKNVRAALEEWEVGIDPGFVDGLLDFEWFNALAFRAESSGEPPPTVPAEEMETMAKSARLSINPSVVSKTFAYDFNRIDWESLSAAGSGPAVSATYLYLILGDGLRSMVPAEPEIMELCDGTRTMTEIMFALMADGQIDGIAAAVKLSSLVARGIVTAKEKKG